MADDKVELKTPLWNNRPISDEAHAHQLDKDSAVLELGERRLPREQAEQTAYDNHVLEQHRQAAAHHYHGMKISDAAGNTKDANRYSIIYTLNMEALGANPLAPLPPEISQIVNKLKEKGDGKSNFTSHPGDLHVVLNRKKPQEGAQEPVGKAERASKLAEVYALAKSILEELEKSEKTPPPTKAKKIRQKRVKDARARLIAMARRGGKAAPCVCQNYAFPHRAHSKPGSPCPGK